MSKRLTQKTLDKMFKTYCEKQSEQFVSKKCAISRTTVRKYKALHDWDGRLKDVQKKARDKQDDSMAESLVKNLKMVQYFKAKILEAVQAGGKASNNPAADLDKMIRLELLLRGEVDSRGEVVNNTLKDIPTTKLLQMQRQLKKENK